MICTLSSNKTFKRLRRYPKDSSCRHKKVIVIQIRTSINSFLGLPPAGPPLQNPPQLLTQTTACASGGNSTENVDCLGLCRSVGCPGQRRP